MLYKDEVVTLVSALTGQSKKDTRETIDALLDVITNKLSEEDSVQFNGFGTFCMQRRSSRTGRNPHNGEPIPIPARKIPSFIPGKELKDETIRYVCDDNKK